MALAKKCDICGKLYEAYNYNKNQNKPSGIILVNVCKDDTYFSNDVIDFCPECMHVITEAIKSLRPTMPEMREDEPMEE